MAFAVAVDVGVAILPAGVVGYDARLMAFFLFFFRLVSGEGGDTVGL